MFSQMTKAKCSGGQHCGEALQHALPKRGHLHGDANSGGLRKLFQFVETCPGISTFRGFSFIVIRLILR